MEGCEELKTEMNIKGMAVGGRNVAIWNGKQAEVYEVAQEQIKNIKVVHIPPNNDIIILKK